MRGVCGFALAVSTAVLFCSPVMSAERQRPNFVLILADDLGYDDLGYGDLGYGDLGCSGSRSTKTLHLDRMADEGLKLTSFYVTSGVCTPSRASLMTGCYPKRVGLHQNEHNSWVLFPGDERGIADSEVTLAELLSNAGYATRIIGKWHQGDQPQFLPTRHGFGSYFVEQLQTIAEEARRDLGDGERSGSGTRSPGVAPDARPLTSGPFRAAGELAER